MITPVEIKKKALTSWSSGAFLRAWITGKNIFPLQIPFGKTGGRMISENYSEIRQQLLELKKQSKEKRGYGYTIDYQSVEHRQLGRQYLPKTITIDTTEDFLRLTRKEEDFELFKKLYHDTKNYLPSILPLIEKKPHVVLKYGESWQGLLDVCLYFEKNSYPNIYLRQITIPSIDTKFIESHKSILKTMLDLSLPGKSINKEFENISGNGFECRYGLKYDEPLVRFRILDEDLFLGSFSDISLPLSDLSKLSLPVDRIFITENKVNGLAFPPAKKSLIIFGMGYGVQSLREIEWLENHEIYYWGDIDTHGFSILSLVRSFLPLTRSFLMDEEIFLSHRDNWVNENIDKRFEGELQNLHDDEQQLFLDIKNNRWGENLRLEQELITFNFITDFLKRL